MDNRTLALGILLLILTIFVSKSDAQHSLQVDDGAGNIGIIAAPTSGGMSMFTLPSSGGMLITTGTTATNPWLLQGNSLSALGASPTQWFGTSTNDDIIMKANSVEILRLVSGGGVVIPGNALSINGIAYTFPAAAPNGVLTNTAGVLSWAAASGGLVNFTESLTTTAPYSATDAAARLLATNATATNITVVLQPKGNGALQAQLADNAATGGNKRGTYAVDWQMLRTLNTQVADGFGAIVGGGTSNTSSGQYATVGGGNNNTASGGVTTVAGGFLNNASGNRSTVGGGQQNTASGAVATVGGGQQNTAFGDFSAIPGGKGLTLGAITAGSFGFLGANSAGTNNMTINEANTAVFGNTNLWLANNTNAASELRFYEANATASGPFPPALLNYTAFKAGVQTADLILYSSDSRTDSRASTFINCGRCP